jgi:hypothetical protein
MSADIMRSDGMCAPGNKNKSFITTKRGTGEVSTDKSVDLYPAASAFLAVYEAKAKIERMARSRCRRPSK